jgi:hypothetical protein
VVILDTKGARNAWDGPFEYFCTLSHALNPKFAARGEEVVDLPVSERTDEWIGTPSVLFAIVSTHQERPLLQRHGGPGRRRYVHRGDTPHRD